MDSKREVQHYKALLPINLKARLLDHSNSNQDQAIDELFEIFENELFTFKRKIFNKKLSIQIIKKSEAGISGFFAFFESQALFEDFLEITFSTTFSLNQGMVVEIDDNILSNYDNKDITVIRTFIADDFVDLIYELLLQTNLAKPGSLISSKGIVSVNNINWMEIYEFDFPIFEAFDLTYGPKYPEIPLLKTNEIRNNFKSLGISFYSDHYTKLELALNCLTYVLSPNLSDPERLVYNLIALETLFTSSSYSISEQLNEKVQLYLEEKGDHKKALKKMYDVRSRFLHGDLQIRPYFLYNNTMGNKVEDDIRDSLLVASKILIRTLQKMIIEKRVELNFTYSLK